MKNEAVIYKRVSSQEQVDNMSLGEQEKICTTFCAGKDFKVAKIFSDEGESAKTAERTQLKEMLEYCRINRNRIGHVVVYKIDRFARSVQDHSALQVLLKKMGIILWSATEPIGETTTGKLMEHVLASFAQFDNDVRSERCRAGMVARSLEGCWVVNAPIGYINVKDELKRPTLTFRDENTVKAVRKFFDMYSTGKYLQNDAVRVAEECKLITTSGKTLSRTGAIGILNNIVYAGKIRNKMTNNKIIDALHPAIIGYDQWKGVQDILAGRKRSYAKPARFRPFYPLKRYLRCGQCGHQLTASAPKGGSGNFHPAYHCTKCTIKRNGVRVSIPKAKAHEDFAARLDELVPSKWAIEVFKTIVLKRWDRDFRDVQEQRRSIDEQLQTLESRRNRMFDMMGDGKINNIERFDSQISRLEMQQEELELERDEMKTVEVDKRQIINEAVHFLAHAGEIWRAATADNKVLFQKLVYEGGLALYPNQTFGTSEPSEIYKQLTEIEKYRETTKAELPSENSALVHLIGFEPTTFGSASRRSIQLSYRCLNNRGILAFGSINLKC